MSNAFEVLGSNENEPIDIIKKKYRKLILQWHPDKALINNVDPETAKKKFTTIQEAWKAIESGRPWEFQPSPSPSTVRHTFGEGDLKGVFFEASEIFRQFFGSGNGRPKSAWVFTNLHSQRVGPTHYRSEVGSNHEHNSQRVGPDLNETDDFDNLDNFMEFMDDKKLSPEEEKQNREVNQGFDELYDHINQIQDFIVRETKTIDTKYLLQNRYSPSIELILYVNWSDIDNQKTKAVTFKRSRRCQDCLKNVCKVCKGNGIMNCKKCLQHGFFIKKNCDKCKGNGYVKEKKKIKVKLEHPESPSFYIFPEDSDEKKGYDLPGDVYLKVIGED